MLLWFNTHLVAAFLLNIGMFLVALNWVFVQSNNYVGVLAAMVAILPISVVGWRTLARDESVRRFGLVICVVGLLAVAAIVVSPQFFPIGLLEDPTIQNTSLLMGMYFMVSAMFFASKKQFTGIVPKATMTRFATSLWFSGFTFLSTLLMVSATWVILYRLTDSVTAALALMCVQLLVVGYCYALYRKTLAANPAPSAA